MRLVYNKKTRTTENAPGVEIRIPGFGNTSTVEWLDPSQRAYTEYFKDIVDAILPLGYVRNINVRGAPFDFRKAPSRYCFMFKIITFIVLMKSNKLWLKV